MFRSQNSNQFVKKNKRIVIFFVLISLIFFTLGKNVIAQQVSLSISPPLLELFIKPKKSVLIAYTIKNLGDPTIIRAKVLPFKPKDNLGNISIATEFYGPIRFRLDNANIQLDKPFFLKTKQSQQLLLRIRVPEGAPEGDYYYTITAQTEPPPSSQGITSPRAKASIGSNILITVTGSGKVEVKGKISLFETLVKNTSWAFSLKKGSIKIFDSFDKIPIVLIAENQGKNLIKPKGEIILKGNFGEKATYKILSQNILSESQRLLKATPSAILDCDNNKKLCHQPHTTILSGFFIGKYKLSTALSFGEGIPNVFASTQFFAFPFKLLGGLFVATTISILIIRKKNSDNEED